MSNNFNTMNPNLKTSFGNFGNISNSVKSDVKNTVPNRGDNSSFFNLSIGFDRISHPTFNNNSAKKIDDRAEKGNALPTQTNSNQNYATNKVVNSKENVFTENNINNDGRFYLFIY